MVQFLDPPPWLPNYPGQGPSEPGGLSGERGEPFILGQLLAFPESEGWLSIEVDGGVGYFNTQTGRYVFLRHGGDSWFGERWKGILLGAAAGVGLLALGIGGVVAGAGYSYARAKGAVPELQPGFDLGLGIVTVYTVAKAVRPLYDAWTGIKTFWESTGGVLDILPPG